MLIILGLYYRGCGTQGQQAGRGAWPGRQDLAYYIAGRRAGAGREERACAGVAASPVPDADGTRTAPPAPGDAFLHGANHHPVSFHQTPA